MTANPLSAQNVAHGTTKSPWVLGITSTDSTVESAPPQSTASDEPYLRKISETIKRQHASHQSASSVLKNPHFSHTSRQSKPAADRRGSEPMTDQISPKDYIDRSMDAVRAQNDARFDKVLNEIKSLEFKVDAIKADAITWKGVWGAAAATTVAVAGLVLAVLAISGDRFDGGMAASSVVSSVISRQEERDRRQDEILGEILKSVDALLAAQATTTPQAPENPSE